MTVSSSVEVLPTSQILGAEVRCGDVRTLDDAAIAAVRQAWLDNLVIVIRGQTLSDPDLIEFGKRFGELDLAPLAPRRRRIDERWDTRGLRFGLGRGPDELRLRLRLGLELGGEAAQLVAVVARAPQRDREHRHVVD